MTLQHKYQTHLIVMLKRSLIQSILVYSFVHSLYKLKVDFNNEATTYVNVTTSILR